MSSKTWIGVLSGAMLLASLARGAEYCREVVLELDYGSEPEQVGVQTPRVGDPDASIPIGPQSFEVIGDTVVYIGDTCNGKIKAFRIGGGLLMMTEGDVDCDNGIAVGKDGRIFVAGPLGKGDLSVFSPSGRKELQTGGLRYSVGKTWVLGSSEAIDSAFVAARQAGLRQRKLEDGVGTAYTYERQRAQPLSARFHLIERSQQRRNLNIEIVTDQLPSDLKGVTSVDYWSVDGAGNLYAVCYSPKSDAKVILEADACEPLVTRSDVVVLVYDTAGRFRGGVRFDCPPIASFYDVAKVMPNGNIYCYNYTAEGLEIVRYRPIEE